MAMTDLVTIHVAEYVEDAQQEAIAFAESDGITVSAASLGGAGIQLWRR
jgi:hypothetical protein